VGKWVEFTLVGPNLGMVFGNDFKCLGRKVGRIFSGWNVFKVKNFNLGLFEPSIFGELGRIWAEFFCKKFGISMA
jgi:hypothetical protein